ncbi:hypothetical protein FQ377_14110 [Arthrobacter echini]|uniref:Uncharacterized protein n=1 Tax=Arthrobacter echini TaxID=1529066 RepID=A0A5D0XJ77_9MICC|nr:hypothetical protein [Arthrobacter echini]TYC96319.1 hypothetical protein FQ377_14110 [Arthrobacter echini]
MTSAENVPLMYPEFNDQGDRNPVRLPLTDASEQWEVNTAQAVESMEPEEPWSMGAPTFEPDQK